MSILSTIGRFAAEFSAARARHQTERTIRSLPVELQKDIGWPDAFDKTTATAVASAPGQDRSDREQRAMACRMRPLHPAGPRSAYATQATCRSYATLA